MFLSAFPRKLTFILPMLVAITSWLVAHVNAVASFTRLASSPDALTAPTATLKVLSFMVRMPTIRPASVAKTPSIPDNAYIDAVVLTVASALYALKGIEMYGLSDLAMFVGILAAESNTCDGVPPVVKCRRITVVTIKTVTDPFTSFVAVTWCKTYL